MALPELHEHLTDTATEMAIARAHLTWAIMAQAVPTVVGFKHILEVRITPWEAPREEET